MEKRIVLALSAMAFMIVGIMVLVEVSGDNTAPTVELGSPGSGEEVTNPFSLSWNGSDAEEDDLSYDVYLDTDPSPGTKVASDIQGTSFSPENMTTDTTYYWKVVAKDQTDENESGTWEFTLNNSPPVVTSWWPVDDGTIRKTCVTLAWLGFDYDDDDMVTYDIFLDTSPDPTRLVETTDDFKCFPEPLNPGADYYWKVVARDGKNSTESDIRQFHISSTARAVDTFNSYGTYHEMAEEVPAGGSAFAYWAFKGDTLKGSVETTRIYDYHFDFYLVKGEELRKWVWGDANDTFSSLRKNEDTTSAGFDYTIPEDGIYCIIVDDSEMGKAPPVDDPDTPAVEVLKIDYTITMKQKIYNQPSGNTQDTDDDGGSGLSDTTISIVCFILVLFPVLTTTWFFVRPSVSKQIVNRLKDDKHQREMAAQYPDQTQPQYQQQPYQYQQQPEQYQQQPEQ